MTSKTSYSSLGKAVGVEIERFRSLILLWAAFYVIVGPLFQLLNVIGTNYSASEYYMFSQLFVNGYTPFYVFAVIIGTLGGLYATHYQNVPSQSNFYHSLPLKRETLLGARIVALALVQMVLMVMVVVCNIVEVAFVCRGSGLPGTMIGAGALHFVYIMLVFMMCLGVALLAGQLTANTLGHVLMTVVLNVTIPFISIMISIGMNNTATYWSTGLITKILSFNVAMPMMKVLGLANSSVSNVNMAIFEGDLASVFQLKMLYWPLTSLLPYMLIAILIYALTFVLYKKRNVEKAGDTLVYQGVGQVIKVIYVVLGGMVGGVAVYAMMGNHFIGFILGAVIAAAVVHAICEMIFSQDLGAVHKNIPFTLVGVVLAVAFFGIFNSSLFDLDKYVPKSEQIDAAVVYHSDNFAPVDLNIEAAKDKETIQKIVTAMDAAAEKNIVRGYDAQSETNVNDTGLEEINFTYKTALGVTTRHFALNKEDAKAIMAPLLNDKNYYSVAYSSLAGASTDSIIECSVSSSSVYDVLGGSETTLIEMPNSYGSNMSKVQVKEGKARADKLLQAIQADMKKRNADTLKGRIVGYATFGCRSSDEEGQDLYTTYPIYEGDAASAAILAQWRENGVIESEETALTNIIDDYNASIVQIDENGYTKLGDISTEDVVAAMLKGDLILAERANRDNVDVNSSLGVALALKDSKDGEDWPYTLYYAADAEVPAEAISE